MSEEKSKVNNLIDVAEYWENRHLKQDLSSVGQKSYSDKANYYLYKIVKKQYEKVLKKLEFEEKSAIDAGAGVGIFCEFLSKRQFNVTAVDISSNALKKLKLKFPQINTFQCKLSKLPFNNLQFEAVHCFDVLYHIVDDSEWFNSINELTRVSKKYLILHQNFQNRKPFYMSKHVGFISYDILKLRLEKLRFQEVMSIPTHVVSSRYLTYRITKFFPRLFYSLDMFLLQLISYLNLNNLGSHHIKVFKRISN